MNWRPKKKKKGTKELSFVEEGSRARDRREIGSGGNIIIIVYDESKLQRAVTHQHEDVSVEKAK